SVRSSILLKRLTPATLQQMSRPWRRSTAAAIAAVTDAGSATSQCRTPSPAAMSTPNTEAPSAANSAAVAAPMPDAAPVTNTRFPLNLMAPDPSVGPHAHLRGDGDVHDERGTRRG